jgi:hypothetical protein
MYLSSRSSGLELKARMFPAFGPLPYDCFASFASMSADESLTRFACLFAHQHGINFSRPSELSTLFSMNHLARKILHSGRIIVKKIITLE